MELGQSNTHNRRKKGLPDELFTALNTYHHNLHYTSKENPDHFLDTAYSHENGVTHKETQTHYTQRDTDTLETDTHTHTHTHIVSIRNKRTSFIYLPYLFKTPTGYSG